MKSKFKFKPIKKSLFLGLLFSMFAIVSSCERIEKKDLQSQLLQENTSLSKEEIQRILSAKVNFESHQVTDEVKFSLPDNYYFQTQFVEKEDAEMELTFGKLDLSTKENYSKVELHNSLFIDYSLYEESVYVVKEKNKNLLTIEDIKSDQGSETIYYEDKNSLVFSADDSFTTFHFQYDLRSESYLIYIGNISWSKKFPLNEKLDLAFHFLQNARNLMHTNFSNKEFTWKDYVESRPKIEINLVKNMFGNFEKEIKAFLDENQSIAPKIDDYSFVKLYRFDPKKEADFFEYLNNLRGYDTVEENKWLRDIFSSVIGYESNSKYKVIQKGNTSIVEVTKFDEDGKVYNKQYGVYCVLNSGNKAFVLKNNNEINEKEVDFYVTVFSYFSNNNSLEIIQK